MPHLDREARNAYHRAYMKRRRAEDPEFRAHLYRKHQEYIERYDYAGPAKLARERDRRHAGQALLNELKSQPCTDCGEHKHPAAMQFDHVRGTKSYTIGAVNVLRDDILFELAKCELRCANCHAVRHWLERNEVLEDG